MVFRGKPSTGCVRCRTRRSKCDEQRPSCTQCRNANETCSGYRDKLDLYFKDETANVLRKCERFHDTTICAATPKRYNSRLPDIQKKRPGCKNDVGVSRLAQRLFPPINQVATCFLLQTYLNGSHFSYVPGLVSKSSGDDTLTLAMECVALASLSRETKRDEIMVMARKCYARALKSTNVALQTVEFPCREGSLAATLLLSLFETLAHTTDGSTAWSYHVLGALKLLELRGAELLQSDTGRVLFKQICDSVNVHCVQQRVRPPTSVRKLQALAARVHGTHSNLARLFELLVVKLADHRASIREGVLTNPFETIMLASSIDREAEALLDMSKSYHFSGPVHRPHQLRNSIRTMRILLNQEMLTCMRQILLNPVPTLPSPSTSPSSTDSDSDPPARESPTQYINPTDSATLLHLMRSTRQTILTQSTHILTTVPPALTPQALAPPPSGSRSSSSPSPNSSTTAIAIATSLLWPLHAAGSACRSLSQVEIAARIVGVLDAWDDRFRLPEAGRLAGMVERGEGEEAGWVHMLHMF